MKINFKKIFVAASLSIALLLGGCSDADIASQNLSTAADNFEINRRIVFYNGITDNYILVVQGLCSLGNNDGQQKLTVTCKTGDSEYKKHFLGLSDNVTFFAEQLAAAETSEYHYRVILKPQSILPNIDVETSITD